MEIINGKKIKAFIQLNSKYIHWFVGYSIICNYVLQYITLQYYFLTWKDGFYSLDLMQLTILLKSSFPVLMKSLSTVLEHFGSLFFNWLIANVFTSPTFWICLGRLLKSRSISLAIFFKHSSFFLQASILLLSFFTFLSESSI